MIATILNGSLGYRVDSSLIGDGSFLRESDKLGVNSVKFGSSLARNMSVVQSTSDAPNPIVSAASSSLTIYIKLAINDATSPSRAATAMTALERDDPDFRIQQNDPCSHSRGQWAKPTKPPVRPSSSNLPLPISSPARPARRWRILH